MPNSVVMIEPSGRGGIAQYTWCLCHELKQSGQDTVIITAEDYEWMGLEPVSSVLPLLRGRKTSPWKLWKAIRGLIRRGYRTWHLQCGSHPGYLALLIPVLRLAGARRILLTAHNSVPHNSGRCGAGLSRLLYRQADVLFVHGQKVAEEVAQIAGAGGPEPTIIPFGNMEALPMPQVSRGSHNEILFFGYINPSKGLDLLIKSMGILRRRGVTVRLTIAGKVEEPWRPYERLLHREGLEDTVVQLGYVPAAEIPEIFSRARVVVLPYRNASQSGLVHLAARFGVPLVATRTGGLADLVADETSGLLVPSDDIEALADTVERLITDDALADRLVEGARRALSEQLSMETMASRTLAAYGSRSEWSGSERGDAGADSSSNPSPFVSILIPSYNEARYINDCLESIRAQNYPSDCMEIIVIDGGSLDDTRKRVRAFDFGSVPVSLLDNPKRIVPTGMNRALEHARGEIIVRVDAHTRIAADYVQQAVELMLRTGAGGVGGRMHPQGETPFGSAVALATRSPFGIGNSAFHYGSDEQEAESVYMGVYWTQLLRTLGGYDEELVRNQDDELNARIRASGETLILSSALKSSYTCRPSVKSLFSQYFQYGSWKVRSLGKTPSGFRLRHIVPPLFVACLVLGPGLASASPFAGCVFLGTVILYCLLAVLACMRLSGAGEGRNTLLTIPLIFFVMHTAYGSGVWHGLLRFGYKNLITYRFLPERRTT